MSCTDIDMKRVRPRLIFQLAILLFIIGWGQSTLCDVWIWDTALPGWSTTLNDGKPIDTTNNENAVAPQVAIDTKGNVYVAMEQKDLSGTGRIYLSRYEAASNTLGIWDYDSKSWNTDLTTGDPIDTGAAGHNAKGPRLAVDANDFVYVVFAQENGSGVDRIYISRFNGTDVRIYTVGGWTDLFDTGDPIDAATGNSAQAPQLAIDSTNQVYVTFVQNNGSENHVYLCRWNGLDFRIWSTTSPVWNAIFTNGDPIDTSLAREADSPKIAIDSVNRVYVAYRQNDGGPAPGLLNVYLSRYTSINGLQIWDNDLTAWNTLLTSGDPVGFSGISAGDVTGLNLTIDPNNRVYLAYAQADTGNNRIFLTRYNGTVVQIWGNIWTSNFSMAAPIDAGDFSAQTPQLIADSNDNIFVAFAQSVASGLSRIHLSRWNGADIQIWNTDPPRGWTTSLSAGDPIDAATGQSASQPQMIVDKEDRIYIAFQQMNAVALGIYLSRYDALAPMSPPVVEIWDQTFGAWTTNFTNADPIDAGTGSDAQSAQLAVNPFDEVFIAYSQDDGAENHIYLSAYVDSGPIGGAGAGSRNQPGGGGTTGRGGCFIALIGISPKGWSR